MSSRSCNGVKWLAKKKRRRRTKKKKKKGRFTLTHSHITHTHTHLVAIDIGQLNRNKAKGGPIHDRDNNKPSYCPSFLCWSLCLSFVFTPQCIVYKKRGEEGKGTEKKETQRDTSKELTRKSTKRQQKNGGKPSSTQQQAHVVLVHGVIQSFTQKKGTRTKRNEPSRGHHPLFIPAKKSMKAHCHFK